MLSTNHGTRLLFHSSIPVPSHPPPIVMAHSTSYSSIKVTWQAIPKEQALGVIRVYFVRVVDAEIESFNCGSLLTNTISGLEKSKMYKVQVAGYTSKGLGNFSREVKVVTNVDSKLLRSLERDSLPW